MKMSGVQAGGMAGCSPSHHSQMTKKAATQATNAIKAVSAPQGIEPGIGQQIDIKA